MADLENARRLANELGYQVDRRRVSAPGALGRRRAMEEDDYVLRPSVEGARPTISFDTLVDLIAYLEGLSPE